MWTFRLRCLINNQAKIVLQFFFSSSSFNHDGHEDDAIGEVMSQENIFYSCTVDSQTKFSQNLSRL